MTKAMGLMSLLVLSCGVSVQPLDTTASPVASRRDGIVGGHVTWGFPQTFNIYMEFADGNAGTCSATLVGRRTLLTAAHCIKSDDKRATATYVDAHNETLRRQVNTFIEADDVIANPEYARAAVEDESGFDLALVKLSREPFVRPMPWNVEPLDQTLRGRTVEATGYGVEGFSSNDSGTKRTITIPIQSVASRTLVTGTNVPLSGTCFGDSGGGIVFRFGDGVRRVIGVNSKLRMQDCGPGTAGRADTNDGWLRPRFEQYDAPSCTADNECVTVGCISTDPDCACVADGQCASGCVAPTSDPDCTSACAQDGVCATVACGTPDPDCAPVGSNCGRDAHCTSRLCRDSPQHPEPYCTQACSPSSPCPSGLECEAGTCRSPVLPGAGIGEPCTPGMTFCEGVDAVCVAISTQGTGTACRQRCLENDDCGKDASCVFDAAGNKACAPVVRLPPAGTVELPAGCSTSGTTGLALAALLLWVLRGKQRPA
jgi:hypothetical protein